MTEYLPMEDYKENNHGRLPDEVGIRSDWIVIAESENRTVAEFAVNGLRSYDIPAVLDSRPGFLGSAGLALRSMRTGKIEQFKIMVPREFQEEAAEVVKIFLGDSDDENNMQDTDTDIEDKEL